MDAYPPEYLVHNLPFVVLSGLGTRPELDPAQPLQDVLPGRAITTISSDIPPVGGERASELLKDFLNYDATNMPRSGGDLSRRGNLLGFRMRAVGRVGQAPAL